MAHGRLQPCGTNTEGAASLGMTPAGHVREPRCTALASCVNVEHTLAGPRPRCACTSGKEAAQHGRHPWCHGMACPEVHYGAALDGGAAAAPHYR